MSQYEKPISWNNDVELCYDVELMPNSNKSIEEAADDMITGVTIGTVQTSEGTYTPKDYCLFGSNPGAYKGEVIEVKETNKRAGIVKVAFSSEIAQTKEMGFAGLLSVAAGDGLGTAYEMSKVRLIDIHLPKAIINDFLGPKFGADGIRKTIGKHDPNLPLVALLLKPNTGQSSEHYARLAKEAALAGVDYIKEDELQFNHQACPLIDRVEKILQALTKAENLTGKKVMYAPNISFGCQEKIIENARKVIELGASAVMINVIQVGLDSLRVLRMADIGVPIHVHRAGHDNYSRGDVGIDLNVLSKLFRLGGADLIHTGPVFGNLYDPKIVLANYKSITSDWFGLKKCMPILSRSATSIVQDSIDYFATDKDISHPANVMFLVDKDVYQYANKETGSIMESTNKFVEIVNKTKINYHRSKIDILRSQGY